MAKKSERFLCTDCGEDFGKWFGKCPNCDAFNTIKAFNEPIVSSEKKIKTGFDLTEYKSEKVKKIEVTKRLATGIEEVDRVLGGGFFQGSFVLFGGNPGIGKSTLALQIFLKFLEQPKRSVFYFSGEESVEQVCSRGKRLLEKKSSEDFERKIFSTNSLENIIETVIKNKPQFVVIDSIQMIGSETMNFGSIAQIKENADILQKLAKANNTVVFVIGHVTKNDEIAGPRILEHLVDAVLYLEGENHSEIRLLRSPKNRFGSTQEVGVFDMQNNGLQELKNPSEFFLSERAKNAFGNAICPVREGARNFLLEIQALTVKTNFATPRRTASGIGLSKLHLLLAVISKFTPFKCDMFDAYLNVVGGLKIIDPASDAAICASILSSRSEKEISAETVIFGEVGLSGEIRRVSHMENRIIEAQKMGFKKIICPRLLPKMKKPKNIEIIEIQNVLELMKSILER